MPSVKIIPATEKDVPEILSFIRALAVFEKLEHQMEATEEKLRATLFGKHRYAEVVFLTEDNKKVAFALFFHNYSTFLAKPGLYLEDLFVLPEFRGRGYGKKLLSYLAQTALNRDCGRLEWWVLDWNKTAIDFYLSIGAKSLSEWIPQRVTGADLVKLAQTAPLVIT